MDDSIGYIRFWEDTAKALTALVCGQVGGAGMDMLALRCNPFEFHKNSGEKPFALRYDRIQEFFQNEALFETLNNVLNKEAVKAWPERCLEDIDLLDKVGRSLSPQMEAEYIYFAACEELIARYSGMLGISLSDIALLAAMAYEKDDFKPGTQICFGAGRPAVFSIELGAGNSGDTFFQEKDLRTVRKLLSGVKKDKNALYFGWRESGGTRGYCCKGYVKKDIPAAFRVTFYGSEKWGFRVGNAEHDLLTAKNRQFQCFDAAFHYSLRRLEEEFRGCGCISCFTSGGLRKFLEAARRQAHGTSVVFAPFSVFPAVEKRFEILEAAGRARSVDGRGGKTGDFYQAVTGLARIDGSLAADLGINDYRFAYFSVILDGRVAPSTKGWASSGARANSVLTFIQDLLRSELEKAVEEELVDGPLSREELLRRLGARKMPIAAVIFSEDGYVTPVLGSEWAAGLREEAAAKVALKILPRTAMGRSPAEPGPHIV